MSYVIDPLAQTATLVEIEPQDAEDFLDTVRRLIGATQVNCIPAGGGILAVWADALGMLKPNRGFWRFKDSPFRYAGTCLVTRVVEGGHPAPLVPINLTPEQAHEQLMGELIFYPSDELVRIVESLSIIELQDGRPFPAVARMPLWRTPDLVEETIHAALTGGAPPETDPVADEDTTGWTVYERQDGTYRAVQYHLRGEELVPNRMVSAPNLEEVRRKLPSGLRRVEPAEDDPAEVVESWVLA